MAGLTQAQTGAVGELQEDAQALALVDDIGDRAVRRLAALFPAPSAINSFSL